MKIALLIALVLFSTSSFSLEEQAIKMAATDYLDAFYFGDTVKLKRSISPSVIKYGYFRAKTQTTYQGEPMSYQDMINYTLSVKKKNNADLAVKFIKEVLVLDVQSQTACVKVKAWWGTDYLLLAKINDRWMITHVLWQSYSHD